MLKRMVQLAAAAVLLGPAAAGAAQIEYVPVGSPGNAADPVTGQGAVPYAYWIGKYEVTNAQYADFLNAKAKSDPLHLWGAAMQFEPMGGIIRSGSEGNFSYAAKPAVANHPVGFVTWYDAARFANWLHNGQGNGDTETGAYTFPTGSSNPQRVITRNPGARVFLPTRDEWYKAAYYDPAKPGGPGYWRYPTRSDASPESDQPPGTQAPDPRRVANWYKDDGIANGYNDGFALTGSTEFPFDRTPLTDVGAYTLAAGPWGTFDMGGNASEFDERMRVAGVQINVGVSGGSFADGDGGGPHDNLMNAHFGRVESRANSDGGSLGFRVATLVPEPGAALIVPCAALLLRRPPVGVRKRG